MVRPPSAISVKLQYLLPKAPLYTEIWPAQEVRALISRLVRLGSDWRSDPREMMAFTAQEREFLHRLRYAIPLHNPEGLAELVGQVPWPGLTGLVFSRCLVRSTNAQMDMLGFLSDQDEESAVLMGRTLVEFGALGLLSALGETHPGEKWLLRLVGERLAQCRFPPRLLDGYSSLRARIYGLLRADGAADRPLDYLHRCVRFSNQAIGYGQWHRDGRLAPGSDADAPPPLAGGAGEPCRSEIGWRNLEKPLPALGLGVQLRFAEGRWCCLHVGHSSMFELNPAAACLVGSFDGVSSGHTALARLRTLSTRPAGELARSIFDMISFLDNAELLAGDGPAAELRLERSSSAGEWAAGAELGRNRGTRAAFPRRGES
ncbi:MAG TPA: hypothetical protein VF619_07915 [Allosphingosinicella sp.]|jgi:hypothetical protein